MNSPADEIKTSARIIGLPKNRAPIKANSFKTAIEIYLGPFRCQDDNGHIELPTF